MFQTTSLLTLRDHHSGHGDSPWMRQLAEQAKLSKESWSQDPHKKPAWLYHACNPSAVRDQRHEGFWSLLAVSLTPDLGTLSHGDRMEHGRAEHTLTSTSAHTVHTTHTHTGPQLTHTHTRRGYQHFPHTKNATGRKTCAAVWCFKLFLSTTSALSPTEVTLEEGKEKG